MTLSQSSSIPFGAWAINWMCQMTTNSAAGLRRPISLASRVTWLVVIAMTVVFLIFNWIIINLLDQHFAEMDEEELYLMVAWGVVVLGEVDSDYDAARLEGAVHGEPAVYFCIASATGATLYGLP